MTTIAPKRVSKSMRRTAARLKARRDNTPSNSGKLHYIRAGSQNRKK